MSRSTSIIAWLCWGWLGLVVPLFAIAAPDAPAATTPDGGSYFGPLVDGRLQGQGRMEWETGARYEGGFEEGFFSGQGRYRFANGDIYEGSFVRGVASGQGRLETPYGVTYVGSFRDGLFEGQGRRTDASGNVYEGEFKNGLFHGNGKSTAPNGSCEGEFRYGEPWGKGECRYVDGRTYRGEFVRGSLNGKGRYEDAAGNVYEGDFVNGNFTGEGAFTGPDGTRQEGRFRNWRLDGPGKFVDGNGTVFEGGFVNGELSGKGRITATDGTRYEGEIKGWAPNGQGELRRPNGDVYKGQLAFGVYEGEGTLTYGKPTADGRTHDTGVWRMGRLRSVEEEEDRRARANVERAIYGQPALLTQALAGLKKSDPQRINMYLLSVAGYGAQEVFRREVEFVRDQFDRDFDTAGRSVVLINSRETVGRVPLATLTSMRQSLAAIAGTMNKERDILFLHLTSHGSREHEISLGLRGMDLPGLSARDLGEALRESGIQWKVIVVSACYAGGFIDELRDRRTLILVAARHDRRSFGCADENDFTYFGRAFFKEALPASASFEDAFSKARTLIGQWEDRDRSDAKALTATDAQKEVERHSLPQMVSAPEIEAHLKRWWRQLPAGMGARKPAAPD